MFDSLVFGHNDTGWNTSHPRFKELAAAAEREQMQFKALTTGANVVQPGDTGGSTLRRQFLFGDLEKTAQRQEHLKLIKLCPTKDAKTILLEWTTQGEYSGGDGFVQETGSDGQFGVDFNDDNYERQSENVKFLAEGKQVGTVAQEVDNIEDPMKTSRDALKIGLMTKANLAGYFGDASKSSAQFNGINAQLRAWLDKHPEDYGIFFDCQGLPLDKWMLQMACVQNINRFGMADLLLQSTLGWGDSSTLLWPEARTEEGKGHTFGTQYKQFNGPSGPIRVENDTALRPGQPRRISGPGADGLPCTTASMDPGSLTFGGNNPWVANVAQAPGVGNFWTNFTKNTDTGPVVAPAVPSGEKEQMGGANRNELAAGSYYFAVSIVYKGYESPAYVLGLGNQPTNVLNGVPTAVAVVAGQIVKLDFDTTTPAIVGLGNTYARNLVKFRVYRAGGPTITPPKLLSDFKFLAETGIPTAGNARLWDNGMTIPGLDNAYLITTKRNDSAGWAFMQLLPMMQKRLPVNALADNFCLLWFTTILLRVRKHHIHFRNVGKAN